MHIEQPLTKNVPGTPIFNFFGQVISVFTSVQLVLLVVLVATEVLLRGAFGYSLGFVEEVIGYLVVGVTLFGAALAIRSNSMFQVLFLIEALPVWVKRLLGILFTVIAILVCVLLAWKTFDLVSSSFSRGKFAPTVLKTPLWIPQLLMPLGFMTLVVFLFEHLMSFFSSKEGRE